MKRNIRQSKIENLKSRIKGVGLASLAIIVAGCSGGVARTAEVQISASDMRQSNISRENMFLDNIQKMPASSRRLAANAPAAAEALAKGAQADPSVTQRIESLGLTVPAEPTGPRHPGR